MLVLSRCVWLARLLFRFALHPITRYVASWLLAIVVGWQSTTHAWEAFDDESRPDGNAGHTAIDFGGQWIMGRMLVTGQGKFLYNRERLRAEMKVNYRLVPESELDALENGSSIARTVAWAFRTLEVHDVDAVMGSFMGIDNEKAPEILGSCLMVLGASDGLSAAVFAGVGSQHAWTPSRMADAVKPNLRGPLYPPINAFVYAPLGALPPHTAYRVMQLALLGVCLFAAAGFSRLSRGRIWMPVAFSLILGYPGFSGAQTLGQNSPITLSILVWGWVLVAAGRSGWAGLVWGLLAFKPVWAVAFFLVPLLTRRWTMCLTMAVTGLLQIALTIPLVGVGAWQDWLLVGQEGAKQYTWDNNWIHLSRDLLGIARRLVLDFEAAGPFPEEDMQTATWLGRGFLVAVIVLTLGLAVWRRGQARAVTGPPAAFLLLGAWLTCYHFMYYDALLSILPVLLLFTEPRRYLHPEFLAWEPLILWHDSVFLPWQTTPANEGGARAISQGNASFLALPAANYGWIRNPLPLLILVFLIVNEQILNPWAGGWLAEYSIKFEMLGWTYTPESLLSFRNPWDTVALIALWLWCGWKWIRQGGVVEKAKHAYGALPITAVDLERS